MTLSLPDNIKELLRVGFDRSVEVNSDSFAQALQDPRDDFHDASLKSMSPFQLSVRLLDVLQELGETEDTDDDPQGYITAILTIELHIFRLNCSTPLQYNPFLSHWVTSAAQIQQIEHADNIPWHWKARLEIIKLALTSPGVEDGVPERGQRSREERSPGNIVEMVSREESVRIDLAPFVRMMEKQGLVVGEELAKYLVLEQTKTGTLTQKEFLRGLPDKTIEEGRTHKHDSLSPLATTNKGKDPARQPLPITSRSNVTSVLQALELNPEEATHALTRLPLDLPSLDLLTQFLSSPTLPDYVETATITREYIQHSLRIIERMGNVFSPIEEEEHIPSGREEQIRAVKLLVMFMRNLLRKGMLPVAECALDLEEVCIRYLFIGEVREFKKMIEGGDLNGHGEKIVGDGIEAGG